VGGAFEKKKSIEGYQVASEQNNVFEATESNNTKCRLSSNHSNNSISETSLCNDINSPFPPTKGSPTYNVHVYMFVSLKTTMKLYSTVM
jgi:hypothetical protein